MSIEYKGGRCVLCGYKKCPGALEFHHLDPKTKDKNLKTGNIRSWDRIKKELEKCILLCSNCHRELHEELRSTEG
jgi:predicted HNH restriction endonuclease